MRALLSIVLVVAAGLLVAQTPIPVTVYGFAGPAVPYCDSKDFCFEGDKNGIDPAVGWPVGAPDVYWLGSDPTSGVTSSHAFTLTGTTTEVDTPFCPNGSWSDLSTGCMKARRFDGTTDYYSSDTNQIADCTVDCTVCSLFRSGQTGTHGTIAEQKANNGVDSGWELMKESVAGDGNLFFYIEDTSANLVNANWDKTALTLSDGWTLFCASHDTSGNLVPYMNADADTSVASPADPVTSGAVPMVIGSDYGTGKDFLGDLVFVLYWDSLLSAGDIEDVFEWVTGQVEDQGAEPTFTNIGPTCGWIAGEIECFSDNFPILGSAMPPGATGAGDPATGLYSGEQRTNTITYSRDFSTNWTETGGPLQSCQTTYTPFADGRCVYDVEDTDGGNSEHIKQTIDITALGTSDDIQICLYAMGDSPGKVDIVFGEDTGGGCSVANHNQNSQATTTSWQLFEWTHSVQDGDCEDGILWISSTDNAFTPADTGQAYITGVQVFLDGRTTCPPTYIETVASAVTAGGDMMRFDGTPFVTGGAFVATVSVLFDFVPSQAENITSRELPRFDDGSGNNYHKITIEPDEKLTVTTRTGAGGANVVMQSAALTWTPGTSYTIQSDLLYAGVDAYEIFLDSVSKDTDATDYASPVGVNTFRIGSSASANLEPNGWISNVWGTVTP